MSINGIPSALGTLRGVRETARPRVEQDRPDRVPAPTSPAATAVQAGETLPTHRAQPSLPVEPPAGTDPELWSILSAEERVFFAKVGAMGPLTYGRVSSQMQAPPAVPRGGRLNVRA